MSNGHRWSKFWWQDWSGDEALHACSLAAQGLWMRLLCIAHEAMPVGHVTLNGIAPNTRELATIVGASQKEVARLIAELERFGVFSRTDDGTIYCRRMVKDAELSDEGRQHIAKRWPGKNGHDPNRVPTSPPMGHPTRKPNGVAISPPTRDPCSLEAEADSEAEAEANKGRKEVFLSPLGVDPAGARESAPSAAVIRAGGDAQPEADEAWLNDDDTPSHAEILARRQRFHDELASAERTPAMVARIAKSFASSAVRPPGVATFRSRQDQLNAIQPQPRPTPRHLSPEQLAAARERARRVFA